MSAKKRNPNGSGNISQRKDGRYELFEGDHSNAVAAPAARAKSVAATT
jgi:hypothetical protein